MKAIVVYVVVVMVLFASTEAKKKKNEGDDNGNTCDVKTKKKALAEAICDLQKRMDALEGEDTEEPEGPEGDEIEQWVSSVTGFSSQYNTDSWSAAQVVGPFNVFPNYGDLIGTWAQSLRSNSEFIELEFAQEVFVKEVQIYETYNAGGVTAVKAKNGDTWEVIWETDSPTVITVSRINKIVAETDFPTKNIRLDVDCTVGSGAKWVEIDAVKLVGYEA